jgi:hypothetical protein
MRPIADDQAIWALREAVPQFEGYMWELRDMYGEDLTAGIVYAGLADFVSYLLEDDEKPDLVEKCLAVVEEVVVAAEIDVVEVIGYGFLDAFDPDLLEQALGYFGPATERLLESLGGVVADLSGESMSRKDLADVEELVDRGYLTRYG